MKKSTLLWTAIIVLFLLNAGTLFFILSRPPHPGHPGRREGNRKFDESIINTLQLNPDQAGQFERMKREHHEQMLQLDEATRQPFEQYFGLLATTGNSLTKDSLEKVIAGLYIKRMQVTYQHFADLKAICTPEQQKRFDLLVPSLMQVMSTGEKNMDQSRRKM